MNEVPQLIECTDHNFAPWCLICTHLVFQESKIAVVLPNDHIQEVDYDWLCPECFEIFQEEGADPLMDVMKCVCMHCANHLLENCKKDIPDEDSYP